MINLEKRVRAIEKLLGIEINFDEKKELYSIKKDGRLKKVDDMREDIIKNDII